MEQEQTAQWIIYVDENITETRYLINKTQFSKSDNLLGNFT